MNQKGKHGRFEESLDNSKDKIEKINRSIQMSKYGSI
jgi:hypothetical protein